MNTPATDALLPQGLVLESFGFKTLVLVNSASHAYTELPIQDHLVLLGPNNRGKTSSLNVVKLFVFPEKSFTSCKKKFAFQSRDGEYYTKEDSFSFYFPTDRSFIIAEVYNPEGEFCMVLYPSNDPWGYGRALVPRPYEAIRNLFWDFSSDSNEGRGQQLPLADRNQVLKALKPYGARTISDTGELISQLYGGASRLSGRRFCLVPLKNGGSKQAVDALRSLYHLAFDLSGTNDQTLPRVLASVIEMGKDREESKVSVSLDESLQEYQRLKKIRQDCQRIEAQQSLWDEIDQLFKTSVRDSITAGRQLLQFENSIQLELDGMDGQLDMLRAKESVLSERLRQAKENKTKSQDHTRELQGELRGHRGSHQAIEKNRTTLAKVLGTYPASLSPREIEEIYEEDITKRKAILTALANAATREAEFSRLTRQIKTLEKRQQALEAALAQGGASVLSHLPTQAASTLVTLNSHFNDVFIEPTPEEKNLIVAFTDLFNTDGNTTLFLQRILPQTTPKNFDGDAARERWQLELDSVKGEINASYQQQKILLNADKPDASQNHDGLQRDIDEAKYELNCLRQRDSLPAAYDESLEKLNQLLLAEAEAVAAYEEADKVLQELNGQYLNVKASLEKMVPRQRMLKHFQARLEGMVKRCDHSLQEALYQQEQTENADPVSEDQLQVLETQLHQLSLNYDRALTKLKQLLSMHLVDNLEELVNKSELNAKEQQECLTGFRTLYLELPARFSQLEKEVAAHNKQINNQIEELRAGARHIESKVSEINQLLGEHRISDLQEIRMVVELEPRFNQLMIDLDRVNTVGNALMDEDFFNRLNEFSQNFFKQQGRGVAIDLQSLIKGVRYHYKKAGHSQYTTKAQSGGTTAATNSILLAILMRQLVPPHVRLSLPLILDEIGNLDAQNIIQVRDVADEYGFKVFAATPELNPAAVVPLRNSLWLGEYICRHPVANDCTTIAYARVERFSEIAGGETHTQTTELTATAEGSLI